MKIKPFALERYFAEYEFSSRYLLSSSDCEPLKMSELLDMADRECFEMWNDLRLAYTESQGLPVLREEIAKLYPDNGPENVMVVNPEEGIFISMNVLLKRGDEVVVTYPGYQSLYELARSKGCKIRKWEPDDDNVFHLSGLEELITDKTRMLIVNFPHNPTGALLKEKDFRSLVEMAKGRGIMIFSDEMYRFLEYDETERLPSACELYQNSISLCGMSKSFALPGLRLGWLVINDMEVMEKVQAFKDYTTICPPAPSEVLALIGLRNRKHIVGRNLEIIGKNISLMEGFAERNPHFIRWIAPKAGSVAFPGIFVRYRVEYFCRCLARKTGAMLLPDMVYGYDKNRVRFGLGRADFKEGLEVLEGFVGDEK